MEELPRLAVRTGTTERKLTSIERRLDSMPRLPSGLAKSDEVDLDAPDPEAEEDL